MKHFEDIWNEAESLSTEEDLASYLFKIKKDLELIDSDPDKIGQILYYIACIAKIKNINVAASLNKTVEEIKIDTYI